MPTKVVVRFKECINVFARLSCFFVGAAALDEIWMKYGVVILKIKQNGINHALENCPWSWIDNIK